MIPLVPTANGFADFDRSDAEPGFYYAELVDTDHDGTYEIEQFANDCMPDCAGGTITHTYYRRDGRTYVPR